MSLSKPLIPSLTQIRDDVKDKLDIHPCLYQIRDAQAQLRGENCITIAATGSGKTLTFWIPLLYNNGGCTIIITVLNILNDQNVKQLEALNIKAIHMTTRNATDEAFQEIKDGKYRVIIASPEKILEDTRFYALLTNENFVSNLFNISIDEGHCVSQLGENFRHEYARLGRLRGILPDRIRFHVVSATLSKFVLSDVRTKLQMSINTSTIIRRSNDRENVQYIVQEIKHPLPTFMDLRYILNLKQGKPRKFIIFMNDRREAELAVEELWKDIPERKQERVVWYHLGMSPQFLEDRARKLKDGTLWGIVCADAAGLGLDISDVELVIQWRYVLSLSTLMHRLGRGGRGPGTTAVGLYLVEPAYWDGRKQKGVTEIGKDTMDDNGENPKRPEQMVGEGGDDLNAASEALKTTPLETSPPEESTVVEKRPEFVPFPDYFDYTEVEYEQGVMDLYINAKCRSICRRAVGNRYFGNHLIEADEEKCECVKCERGPDGESQLPCCDTCDPTLAPLPIVPAPEKPKPKRYIEVATVAVEDMTESDIRLKKALRKWCYGEMERRGFGGEDFYGTSLIMSERVLRRIVDIARVSGIPDALAFVEQVRWCDAQKYADEILEIVRSIYPGEPSKPLDALSTD